MGPLPIAVLQAFASEPHGAHGLGARAKFAGRQAKFKVQVESVVLFGHKGVGNSRQCVPGLKTHLLLGSVGDFYPIDKDNLGDLPKKIKELSAAWGALVGQEP
eukprot:2386348-Alexandrium_andersonii.AAC.1